MAYTKTTTVFECKTTAAYNTEYFYIQNNSLTGLASALKPGKLSVNWGDGTTTDCQTYTEETLVSHGYAKAGTYTVQIIGTKYDFKHMSGQNLTKYKGRAVNLIQLGSNCVYNDDMFVDCKITIPDSIKGTATTEVIEDVEIPTDNLLINAGLNNGRFVATEHLEYYDNPVFEEHEGIECWKTVNPYYNPEDRDSNPCSSLKMGDPTGIEDPEIWKMYDTSSPEGDADRALSFWACMEYTTTYPQEGCIFSYGKYGADKGWQVKITYEGYLKVSGTAKTSTEYTAPVACKFAHWNHFVVNKKDGVEYLYLNGVQIGEFAHTRDTERELININGAICSGGELFKGWISSLRFYGRALTLSEIKALFKEHERSI